MTERPSTTGPTGGSAIAGAAASLAGSGEASFDQVFGLASLSALRSAVAAWAAAMGLSERSAEALVMVASELASNSIRHGGGHGRLSLWMSDRSAVCQVTDTGLGLTPDPTLGTVLPEPAQPGGRGLWIIRSVSRECVFGPGPDGRGTTVTVTVGP